MNKLWIYGSAVMNGILAVFIVYMLAFASKGPRYTAFDGDRDRADSKARDAEIVLRLEKLEARQ